MEHVYITPLSDIVGIGEPIDFSATCSFQGAHGGELYWTGDAPVPGTASWFEVVFGFPILSMPGNTSTVGTYDFSAACPNHGEAEDPAFVHVVEVASLLPNMGTEVDDGDGEAKTKLYLLPVSADTAPVVVTATPNPAPPDSLPDSWTLKVNDQVQQPDRLHANISRATPGAYVVRCSTGTSWRQTTIRIVGISVTANPCPDPNRKLWWFNGERPSAYPWCVELAADGLPSTGTFSWTVVSGTDKVEFSGGGDTITRTNNNTAWIESAAASTEEDDVTIALSYNGTAACTARLTVFAPQHVTYTEVSPNPDDDAVGEGFLTTYYIRVLDMFSDAMPAALPVNGTYSDWTSLYQGENWPVPSPSGVNTNATGDFGQEYGYSQSGATPACVNPGAIGWDSAAVQQAAQYYKAGSATPGNGRIFGTHDARYYRGCGRQE